MAVPKRQSISDGFVTLLASGSWNPSKQRRRLRDYPLSSVGSHIPRVEADFDNELGARTPSDKSITGDPVSLTIIG